MRIRLARFNLYLLAVALAAFAVGCRTADSKRNKEISTLRFHLEVRADGTGRSNKIPVFREKPIMVNAEREPIIHEGHITAARIVDVFGGFAIQVEFDRQGTWVLESTSASYQGKRMAIYSEFGNTARWLAAPVITHRIGDGKFTFTPDATREEADQIVLGINNLIKKNQKKSQW